MPFVYPTDTKTYAVEKLQNIEAHDGFPGELNANVVSEVYKGLGGMRNSTYLENIAIADRWWTEKYFSYLNSPPQMSADINSIEFDTTVVSRTKLQSLSSTCYIIYIYAYILGNLQVPILLII